MNSKASHDVQIELLKFELKELYKNSKTPIGWKLLQELIPCINESNSRFMTIEKLGIKLDTLLLRLNSGFSREKYWIRKAGNTNFE